MAGTRQGREEELVFDDSKPPSPIVGQSRSLEKFYKGRRDYNFAKITSQTTPQNLKTPPDTNLLPPLSSKQKLSNRFRRQNISVDIESENELQCVKSKRGFLQRDKHYRNQSMVNPFIRNGIGVFQNAGKKGFKVDLINCEKEIPTEDGIPTYNIQTMEQVQGFDPLGRSHTRTPTFSKCKSTSSSELNNSLQNQHEIPYQTHSTKQSSPPVGEGASHPSHSKESSSCTPTSKPPTYLDATLSNLKSNPQSQLEYSESSEDEASSVQKEEEISETFNSPILEHIPSQMMTHEEMVSEQPHSSPELPEKLDAPLGTLHQQESSVEEVQQLTTVGQLENQGSFLSYNMCSFITQSKIKGEPIQVEQLEIDLSDKSPRQDTRDLTVEIGSDVEHRFTRKSRAMPPSAQVKAESRSRSPQARPVYGNKSSERSVLDYKALISPSHAQKLSTPQFGNEKSFNFTNIGKTSSWKHSLNQYQEHRASNRSLIQGDEKRRWSIEHLKDILSKGRVSTDTDEVVVQDDQPADCSPVVSDIVSCSEQPSQDGSMDVGHIEPEMSETEISEMSEVEEVKGGVEIYTEEISDTQSECINQPTLNSEADDSQTKFKLINTELDQILHKLGEQKHVLDVIYPDSDQFEPSSKPATECSGSVGTPEPETLCLGRSAPVLLPEESEEERPDIDLVYLQPCEGSGSQSLTDHEQSGSFVVDPLSGTQTPTTPQPPISPQSPKPIIEPDLQLSRPQSRTSSQSIDHRYFKSIICNIVEDILEVAIDQDSSGSRQEEVSKESGDHIPVINSSGIPNSSGLIRYPSQRTQRLLQSSIGSSLKIASPIPDSLEDSHEWALPSWTQDESSVPACESLNNQEGSQVTIEVLAPALSDRKIQVGPQSEVSKRINRLTKIEYPQPMKLGSEICGTKKELGSSASLKIPKTTKKGQKLAKPKRSGYKSKKEPNNSKVLKSIKKQRQQRSTQKSIKKKKKVGKEININQIIPNPEPQVAPIQSICTDTLNSSYQNRHDCPEPDIAGASKILVIEEPVQTESEQPASTSVVEDLGSPSTVFMEFLHPKYRKSHKQPKNSSFKISYSRKGSIGDHSSEKLDKIDFEFHQHKSKFQVRKNTEINYSGSSSTLPMDKTPKFQEHEVTLGIHPTPRAIKTPSAKSESPSLHIPESPDTLGKVKSCASSLTSDQQDNLAHLIKLKDNIQLGIEDTLTLDIVHLKELINEYVQTEQMDPMQEWMFRDVEGQIQELQRQRLEMVQERKLLQEERDKLDTPEGRKVQEVEFETEEKKDNPERPKLTPTISGSLVIEDLDSPVKRLSDEMLRHEASVLDTPEFRSDKSTQHNDPITVQMKNQINQTSFHSRNSQVTSRPTPQFCRQLQKPPSIEGFKDQNEAPISPIPKVISKQTNSQATFIPHHHQEPSSSGIQILQTLNDLNLQVANIKAQLSPGKRKKKKKKVRKLTPPLKSQPIQAFIPHSHRNTHTPSPTRPKSHTTSPAISPKLKKKKAKVRKTKMGLQQQSLIKIKKQNKLLKQKMELAAALVKTKRVLKKRKNKNKKLRKQARKWTNKYKPIGERTPRWAASEVLFQGNLQKYRPNIKTTSKIPTKSSNPSEVQDERSSIFESRWCQVVHGEFRIYHDEMIFFDKKPLIKIPINKIKAVEKVQIYFDREDYDQHMTNMDRDEKYQFEIFVEGGDFATVENPIDIIETTDQDLNLKQIDTVKKVIQDVGDFGTDQQPFIEGHVLNEFKQPTYAYIIDSYNPSAWINSLSSKSGWTNREVEWSKAGNRFIFQTQSKVACMKWVCLLNWLKEISKF